MGLPKGDGSGKPLRLFISTTYCGGIVWRPGRFLVLSILDWNPLTI